MAMMCMAEHGLLNASNIQNRAQNGLNQLSIGINQWVLVKHVAQIRLKPIQDLSLIVPYPKRATVEFISVR